MGGEREEVKERDKKVDRSSNNLMKSLILKSNIELNLFSLENSLRRLRSGWIYREHFIFTPATISLFMQNLTF